MPAAATKPRPAEPADPKPKRARKPAAAPPVELPVAPVKRASRKKTPAAPVEQVETAEPAKKSRKKEAKPRPIIPLADRHKHLQDASERILFAARCLDEVEAARIACQNRERAARYRCGWCGTQHDKGQMEAMGWNEKKGEWAPDSVGFFVCTKCCRPLSQFDKLGEEWKAVMEDRGNRGKPHPMHIAMSESIAELEDTAILQLEKAMEAHPFHSTIETWVGVGEKQCARLLAEIGDPYWNSNARAPRTVSQLWAYCGYRPIDGQAQRRRKGVKSNWNDTARMRANRIVESVVKTKTTNPDAKYGRLWDEARAHEEGRVHDLPCEQCGVCDTCGKPPGKNGVLHLIETGCPTRKVRPVQPGDPLKPSHCKARADRKVAKEILKDLWCLSRDWQLGLID